MIIKDKPMGYGISTLTHPTSQEIESKFRFFADCLNLINTKAGEYYDFETETHITLIRTLQYSAEAGHINYSPKVAKHLVPQIKYIIKSHPLLSSSDRLMNKFYMTLSTNIAIISNITNHTLNDIIKIDTELKSMLQIISSDYIDNIVSELSTFIGCQHKLKKHSKDLDYYARIIFSYFYLNGYNRTEIAKFVSQLLQGSVEQDDDKIYVSGLLPINLHRKVVTHNRNNDSFNQKLFDEVKLFFDTRSTKKQIEGFVNLANYEKREFKFIFKVEGVSLSENELIINGIRFINTENFRNSYPKNLEFQSVNHFLSLPSVLLEYSTTAYTQNEAVNQAVVELKEKLDKMGFILNKNFHLDLGGYLIKMDMDYYWCNEILERTSINELDLEILSEQETAVAKKEFRDFLNEKERILYEAYGELNLGKSLHDYSKFLEQFTMGSLTGIKDMAGIPKRILAMAYLLILMESESLKLKTKGWSYSMIVNSIPIPEMGKENKVELQDFRGRKYLPSLTEMKKRFVHAHTRYRINRALDSRKGPAQIEAFHYYIRFFLMLVRYRNIQEHMNVSERQYARKLKVSVNIIFNRITNYLAREFNKQSNLNLTPEQVLNNLILEGKNKADLLGIVLQKNI